ncbi:unnamed protein product [Didymodactylos carnosus]|uniref:Uncharacterized protein n=1 Tax=Didymodactylos carnosus TaxID=1234261 RepID=A0A814NGV5_9BILA|nr:unnamed protein product [Didymodactylos carnosus]CAF3857420.1 unnamed protein product [Didymodactylos carnosus]
MAENIYDLQESGVWKQTSVLPVSPTAGPVLRLCWAHPEFGVIIATATFDRFVNVWEEVPASLSDSELYATKWVNKGPLCDLASTYNTVAIKFAPKHLNLILAIAFYDGIVRFYDFTDGEGRIKEEIQTKMSCLNCLSWSTARYHLPTVLAIGSDDCNSTGNKLQLWEYDMNRKAIKVEQTIAMTDTIKDLQFAQNFGQSYHLLAVASHCIQLVTIKPQKKEPNDLKASVYEFRIISTLDDHGSTVWRVSFNVFGSVLYSCGDDGRVRQFKGSTNNGPWICINTVQTDGSMIPTHEKPITESNRTDISSNESITTKSE